MTPVRIWSASAVSSVDCLPIDAASFLTKEEVDGSSSSTVTTEGSLLLGCFVFGIPDDNALDAHRTRFALRVWVQAPKRRAGRVIEVLSIALE
jgi:hypothetical protein